MRFKCPWCGSYLVVRVDEEMCQCRTCFRKIDFYEAQVLAGVKKRKKVK